MTEISDAKAEAERLKEEANAWFKAGQYSKAIKLYTKAIGLDPNNPILYSNRSIAFLKVECIGCAFYDATKAIELDNTFVKAYYRRAAAQMYLGKFKLALKDYETVFKARPNDPDAKEKYNECLKLVRKMAFEKAIAVEDNANSLTESIDINSMIIEDDYTGPALTDGKVTVEFVTNLMETFRNQGKLHRKYAYKILRDIKEFFMKQPSLIDVTIGEKEKFTVCGDIHGQFYDLLNIFKLNGLPSEDNPYLFNGDFVDRGNHESKTMNQMYGFEGEVTAKYTAEMAKVFTEVYNWLPLAHCLNKRVLVMHGGLFSTDNVTLDDIRAIDRNRQPPDEGLMCDLLWSDPQPANGRSSSKRGVGVQFGPDITEAFTSANNLDYIIRSHEVKNEGYEVAHDGKCITVFSAPNYCDTMGNKGAYITLNGKDMNPEFHTYDAVEHPDVKLMTYANSLLLSLLS